MAARKRKVAADGDDVQPISEVQIMEILEGELTACILGVSPFVFHRVSEKTKSTLLFPPGRLTKAEKAVHLKHDPLKEYRDSVYRRFAHEAGPTRLLFPAAAFKRAMATAAIEIPGTAKAKIDRLTWAVGHRVDMYGRPEMLMDVVRSADMARTPDVHTWAILPEWATIVTISFAKPILSEIIVARLLAAAGKIIGVGDGRQEKGKRSFGQFKLVDRDDADFQRIIRDGGMVVQDAALKDPDFFDADTEDLYTSFEAEYVKRAQDLRSPSDDDEGEEQPLAAE